MKTTHIVGLRSLSGAVIEDLIQNLDFEAASPASVLASVVHDRLK